MATNANYVRFIRGTPTAWANLKVKDDDCLYFIAEKNSNAGYLYLGDRKPNKTLFVKYINNYAKTHQPNSVHLIYSSLISIFKFEKKWKLINQCKDIKLPKMQQINRKIISLQEYENVKNIVKLNSKIEKRNWIIFSFLFINVTLNSSQL